NALALNNLAVALARLGKDAEAIDNYKRVLRAEPGNVTARMNLSTALMRQGNDAEALAHLTEAARLRPDVAYVRYNLGYLLLKQGRADLAAQHLAEAARLSPEDMQARFYLSIALARAGRTEEAARGLAETMKQPPDSPSVTERLAWVLAASPEAGFRDGAQAIKLAQQACDATGNRQPGPLDALGAAYAEAGRFADAIEAAHRAIDRAAASGGAPSSAAADPIRARLKLYEAGKPFRDRSVSLP
ncbi:MAG TPA: tetratricopeptide repeat protein, partial [Candidatus Polarisedimenticolia bacterium]|nr:tetratricopeptide repeat protein [Candidatus Polarisedimenticolia bacterium]